MLCAVLRVVLIAMFPMAVAGCGRMIPVQLESQRAPGAELQSMGRFAVAHSPAAPQRGYVLTRRVTDAFARYLAANDFLAAPEQKPLATAADRNDLLERASSYAHRAFQQRGFELDPADPQFVMSLDCVHGPVSYRVPPPIRIDGRADPNAGRRVTEYAHGVAVYVYDVRRPRRPVWFGVATSICDVEDPSVMRRLLDELAAQFPAPTDGLVHTTTTLD